VVSSNWFPCYGALEIVGVIITIIISGRLVVVVASNSSSHW